MRTIHLKALCSTILVLSAGAVRSHAATTFDFNSGLPAGTAVYGSATNDSSGGVGGSGVLKLTIAATTQNGSFIIEDFNSGGAVTDFDATFMAYIGGGTATPADGYSFNFAADLPSAAFVAGEEGAGSGLTISFDTYVNVGETSPVIEVRWGGMTIASVNRQVSQLGSPSFVPVHITLCPGGYLNLTYNNEVIFNHLSTGYTPLSGARFGFGGRTGGAWDNHWIDDLSIALNQTFAALTVTGPTNQTANEGQSATFSVTIDSDCYQSAQWYSNNIAIPEGTNLTYTTPPATLGMSGTLYKVDVVNSVGTTTSGSATLSVVPAPTLLGADSRRNPNGIFVFFSEDVSAGTGLNPANYTVSGGISVTGAVFNSFVAANGPQSAVMLQTMPALVGGSNYTVTVTNVQDTDSNTINPNPSTASFIHRAGNICYDFNSGVPAGLQLFGNARVSSSDGVGNSGALKLTDALLGQNGAALLDDFTGGVTVNKFRASYLVRIDTDLVGQPADGMSFNFANNLPNGGYAEEGAGNGFIFAWDNFNSGAAEGVGTQSPSFDLKWGGNGIANIIPGGHRTIAAHNYPAYLPVVVQLNSDATASLQVNNTNVFTNLPISSFAPITGGRFGLGARTGGLMENHWIDNLCITIFNGGPVTLTQQPASQTNFEVRPFKMQIAVDGSPPYFIQWFSNDVAIAGANSETYSNTATLDLNGVQYKAVVSNEFSSVTSDVATLNVLQDNDPPVLLSVRTSRSLNTVSLTFNEALDPGGATDPFNTSISGLTIVDRYLTNNNTTLVLVTSPQTPATSYMLHAEAIQDAGTNNTYNADLTFNSWVITPGFVQMEIYRDLEYDSTIAIFTANPKFPNRPDLSFYSHATAWEQPQTGNPLRQVDDGSLNYYGLRMSGFFTPRVSGDHRFYLTHDDHTQLRMSTNGNTADPANLSVLTSAMGTLNLPVRDDPTNSVTVAGMIAGQPYYFEALLKENTGGDYLRVFVREPGNTLITNSLTPIRNFLLSCLADPYSGPSLSITQQPTDATVQVGQSATFQVGTSFSGNNLPFYQWKVNGTPVAGANGPTFTTAAATPGDDGASVTVVAYLPGVSVTSSAATWHVVASAVLPQITGAAVLGTNMLSVGFSEAVTVDGPASITDPTNYLVNGTAGLVQSVTVVSSSAMKLTVGAVLSGTTTVRASTAIHDAAGNHVAVSGDVAGYSDPFTAIQGLSLADIANSSGAPSPAGTVFTLNNKDFTVTAGGSDVWSGGDQFSYVYQQRTGDFDVKVRVDRIDQVGDPNSKGGLNIRQTLDGSSGFASRMVWVYPTPTNGDGRFQAAIRAEPGRDVTDVNSGAYLRWGRSESSPWVRVKRVGKSFTYYNSYDGQNWNPIGLPQGANANLENALAGNNGVATASDFPDTLYVGLGVVSHVQGTPATAQFAEYGDWSYPNASVTVTGNPLDTTGSVGGTVAFKARGLVNGAPQLELLLQWQRNGVDIPGAVSSYVDGYTYTTPPLTMDDNGAQYRAALIVSGAPRVYTAAATVSVTPSADNSLPLLVSARRDPTDQTKIILSFNKLLRPSSVTSAGNYSIDQGVSVLSAQPMGPRKVILTTSGLSGLSNCVSYAISVSGVQDGNGNAMVATNTTIPVYAAPRALQIVGNYYNMNLSDRAISNRLDLLGYEVTPISATAANRRGAAAANGMSLIYDSSTAGTTIGSTFRDVAVPTIVARRELFVNYDMVPAGATNFGTIGGQWQLGIVNSAHPLAGGLGAGAQTVVDNVGLGTRNFNYASNLAASASIVARLNATGATITNTLPAHFGFEVGAAMLNSRTAASRRVGTYLEDNVAVFWHSNGMALFDGTVRWIGMPSIIQQPQSLVVAEGGNGQFCAVAGSPSGPAYQWYKGGAPLSGQTSEKLTLNNVQSGDAGNYTVVIGNASGGSITSAVAVLTVAVPPVITVQPQGQTNLAGSNVTFSVTATGGALSYQWKLNGSPIAGATSSTLSLTNIQPANSGTYTVMVTNLAGMVTSDPAILRVLVRPTITGVNISGGTFSGTISTVAGLQYTVQSTTNLNPTISWTTLTSFTGDGSTVTLGEPVGPGNRFYRIIIE